MSGHSICACWLGCWANERDRPNERDRSIESPNFDAQMRLACWHCSPSLAYVRSGQNCSPSHRHSSDLVPSIVTSSPVCSDFVP
uniref:Uncharacterized protein n=1 Tax=Picea glauca TaxID=3330 RepID=A0A117NG51_PICGL|nr:hypothetical protein ABT39_MTgene1758 [Picea glauca]